MAKITELSIQLANLIAAGEVVNRPANAIKELCENSIDAGASKITVEIQRGGIALMRVSDNGCGMEPEDLVLSVKRHATSKIKDKEDLERIMTMGFRGEALPSIASVSRLRIVSKTEDAEFGHMISVGEDGGVELTERGAATGTTVIAEDLFHNVPARRKFLKRDSVEAGAVISVVERLALSHPEIAFTLLSDGVLKLETPGSGRLEDTVYTVFGKGLRGKLLPLESYEDGIKISGYVGSPMYTRVNRQGQYFFVNKRCVTSPMMSSALSQAFSSYIPEDKFPFCVLFVDVNPLSVDVNIHPAKLEVKFVNESMVFGVVYRAVANALTDMSSLPSLGGREACSEDGVPRQRLSEMPAPFIEEKLAPREQRQLDLTEVSREAMLPKYQKEEPQSTRLTEKDSSSGLSQHMRKAPISGELRYIETINSNGIRLEVYEYGGDDGETDGKSTRSTCLPEVGERTPERAPEKPKETPSAAPESPSREYAETPKIPLPETEETDGEYRYFRIIGEFFNKYALIEATDKDGDEKLIMIDKHAAHERILFEDLRRKAEIGESGAQMLLVPIELPTGAYEANVADVFKETLDGLGFRCETGFKDITLYSIPLGMEEGEAKELFLTVLSELHMGERGDRDRHMPPSFEKALFTVACKAALKGGREYPPEMLSGIVRSVLTNPKIRFCPHGRPVAFEVSLGDIDNIFKR